MPNTAQAKKRLRQDAKRSIANKAKKSRMRTEMKKFYAAIKDNNVHKAEALIVGATKLVDKAAKTRLLHPRNAARKKQAMSKALQGLGGSPNRERYDKLVRASD